MRCLAILLALSALPLAAAPKTAARPEEAGMSSARLQRVHAVLDGYIRRGEIAGAVSAVLRHGKLVYLDTQGVADLETKQPLKTDALFRLASMTKPITSIAAMMLHEEGRFLLDDPISKFLPEFKNPVVAVANKPNERFEGGYHLVPAEREITARHLLSHTAGLASGTGGPTIDAAKKLTAARKPVDTLETYIKQLAKLPLNFQPGSAWEYGPATDVLGRLIEVTSGRTLDEFFRERIFRPLEMTDTHFYVPAAKLNRLASAYAKSENGDTLRKLPPSTHEINGGYFSGGGGLAGSVDDYLRFCEVLLNKGSYRGTRLVSRKTIELMTANQIGNIPVWNDTLSGYRFGLGFRVLTELGQSPTLGSVGSYGWGGAYGTYFWVDPKEDMVGLLMFQLMPYAHLNIRFDFQNAVTQAIID